MLRLAVALFLVQTGFHGFTAALPIALTRAGIPDPQIGLIVGTAALVQLPAAFVAGVVLDRVGGRRVFALGGASYLIGCGILLLPGVEPGAALWPLVAARLCQGIGLASVLPAALSLVPRLAPPARRGFSLAFMGSAHNLTLVAMPPLSLAVLTATSLHGVALTVTALVVAGLVVAFAVPFRFLPEADAAAGRTDPTTTAVRRFGFAFRRSWTSPLAILLLYVVHWGVVTAYLPPRAEAQGADIGLFFAADGLAILVSRVPSGWLADRMRPNILILVGLGATAVAIALLAGPLSTAGLVVAGMLSGGGAGLVMSPVLVDLSRRSADADRGSAFSLFSASLAGALVLGSIGAAPLVGALGFSATLTMTLIGIAGAAVLTLADDGLRRAPAQAPGPA